MSFEHNTPNGVLCRAQPEQRIDGPAVIGREPMVHDCLWMQKIHTAHEAEMQLQYMLWDGQLHWGKETKASPEYSLNPGFVTLNWETPEDCLEWVSKPNKWVKLSPGDIKIVRPRPPSDTQIPIEYPQIEATCLASSFASVLHVAGCFQEAKHLQHQIINGELTQGANLLHNFSNAVSALKIRDKLGRYLVFKRVKNYDICYGPTPAAVVLQGTDNRTRHAISILDDYIIDSSWPFVLPRDKCTLDWCCLPAQFRNPHVVYILVPPTVSPESRKRKKKKKH